MTAYERLIQAGNVNIANTGTGSVEVSYGGDNGGTVTGSEDTGTVAGTGGINGTAKATTAAELRLGFMITVTVSVTPMSE